MLLKSICGQRAFGGLVICLISLVAGGQSPEPSQEPPSIYAAATRYVEDYINALIAEHTAVFYVECTISGVGGKAEIYIPVGTLQGLYVERSEAAEVVNTATLSWREDRWITDVSQGGMYTVRRANALIAELLEYPFVLQSPGDVVEAAAYTPVKVCSGA